MIRRRLYELTALVRTSRAAAEVIVVSDGSTEATAALARTVSVPEVRVLEQPERRGKAFSIQMAMLFENRRLAYQQAHLRLDAARARPEELVEQLIERLE